MQTLLRKRYLGFAKQNHFVSTILAKDNHCKNQLLFRSLLQSAGFELGY